MTDEAITTDDRIALLDLAERMLVRGVDGCGARDGSGSSLASLALAATCTTAMTTRGVPQCGWLALAVAACTVAGMAAVGVIRDLRRGREGARRLRHHALAAGQIAAETEAWLAKAALPPCVGHLLRVRTRLVADLAREWAGEGAGVTSTTS